MASSAATASEEGAFHASIRDGGIEMGVLVTLVFIFALGIVGIVWSFRDISRL